MSEIEPEKLCSELSLRCIPLGQTHAIDLREESTSKGTEPELAGRSSGF